MPSQPPYDAATRSEVQTDQDKAASRSMFKVRSIKTGASLDLYCDPTAAAGQKGRWIKTAPGHARFACFRICGPGQAAFDKR